MIPVLAGLLTAAVAAIAVVDRRTSPTPDAAGFSPRTAVLLARVEGMRLLRHPLVWLTGAAALLGLPYGGGEDWRVRWGLTGAYLSLLAVAGFALVHVAVSRDRRAGTEELSASLPIGPRTRVAGHLLSSLWLVVPATLGWAAYLWWRLGPSGALPIQDGTVSYRWEPPLAELAQGPLLLLVALLLAVAAGVWWRHPAVGVLVPLLLFLSPVLWMVPLTIDVGPIAPYLEDRIAYVDGAYLAWHYLFMVGLGLLAVATAMLRHGPRRWWGGLAGLAGAALWVGFLLQRHEWFLR